MKEMNLAGLGANGFTPMNGTPMFEEGKDHARMAKSASGIPLNWTEMTLKMKCKVGFLICDENYSFWGTRFNKDGGGEWYPHHDF